MINRRTVLGGFGATAAALVLSRLLPGGMGVASGGAQRRFLFVFNYGGWDPTHTFATLFGSSNVDMPVGSSPATAGNIPYVDHPDRPAVKAFLERYHQKTLVINGLSVASLAHEVCASLALTGKSTGQTPDWGTLLAWSERDRYTLPHLVLSGLSFPGSFGTTVARVGESGQLEGLLSGAILDGADLKGGRPNPLQERILDDWAARRAAAAAGGVPRGVDPTLHRDLAASVDRARALKDARFDMDFSPGSGLTPQLTSAIDALSMDLARCVTVSNAAGQWDTHSDNNPQSGLWEGLFGGLLSLMEDLERVPVVTGGTLADETILVVLSEMGRTPKLNSSGGKDHWPYTSMMIVGPGITGDRVVGDFDAYYYGLGVERATAEIDPNSPPLSPDAVGAALLTLADVDPEPFLPGVVPLTGILA